MIELEIIRFSFDTRCYSSCAFSTGHFVREKLCLLLEIILRNLLTMFLHLLVLINTSMCFYFWFVFQVTGMLTIEVTGIMNWYFYTFLLIIMLT